MSDALRYGIRGSGVNADLDGFLSVGFGRAFAPVLGRARRVSFPGEKLLTGMSLWRGPNGRGRENGCRARKRRTGFACSTGGSRVKVRIYVPCRLIVEMRVRPFRE